MISAPPSRPSSPEPRFYGRRYGRRLRPGRRRLMSELLPRLRIDLPAYGRALDPATFFPSRPERIWLEIGFGNGEHMLWQAAANLGVGFLGAEPYVNGIAAALARIESQGLDNVRLYDDDVRPLLNALTPRSLDRVFILFPDPWPKARHQRRRIVSAATLATLGVLLRPGGELRLATDDSDYLRWMLGLLHKHSDFAWCARRPSDWRVRPPDWPATRYERKTTAAGRAPVFLRFTRRP